MRRLRISASLVLTALLAACGGGGGANALPNTGGATPSHQMATATFTFKIPGKATMSQLRRSFYSSQATQGVAIDWQSTDPTHPDLAYPISATCPATLPQGITACGPDPKGGTDYTFTLAIAPGSYAFAVSTFDAAPSGTIPTAGVFASPAAMLAQGQLPAPLVIAAGQTNTVPSMTFYGVPASVGFVPAASQPHVTQLGASSYGVIGNEPQLFFAEALDADGFVIASSDSGAPSIMVCESTSDPQQYFKISSTADPNEFSLQAMAAPSGMTGATIDADATAGGTGLPTATTNYQVLPIQELWNVTTTSGAQPGLLGYALMPGGGYKPQNPIDDVYDNPALNLCGSGIACSFQAASGNADGSFIVGASYTTTGKLYQIAASNGGPLALPVSSLPYAPQFQASNIAIDAAGHTFVVDGEMSTLVELNTPTDAAPSASITSGLAKPTGLAVAPSISAIPTWAQQTVWVGDGSQTMPIHAYVPSGTTLTPIPITFAGPIMPSNASAIGFDSNGYLWVYDGSGFFVFAISGSASGATLTELLAAAHTPTFGPVVANTLTPTAQGTTYYTSQFYGPVALTLTGCPTACAVSEIAISGVPSGNATFVTP